MTYAQSAIDEFSEAKRCSDCDFCRYVRYGIDVPEVLNLVFFKKVMSKKQNSCRRSDEARDFVLVC